ncbi:MAG: aconitase family protein, partial [Merdibacter sp.]
GSCTNSSFTDLLEVARILKGKTIHPEVSLVISFGSKQVLRMLSRCGALDDLIAAGARVLEATCGPCIGMGQSPQSNGVSLRTFNRNFYGRSGTMSADLSVSQLLHASAIAEVMQRGNDRLCQAGDADAYLIDDDYPAQLRSGGEIKRARTSSRIRPTPLAETIEAQVMIKVGDNITTDHIMPAGAKILPPQQHRKDQRVLLQPDRSAIPRPLPAVWGGWISQGKLRAGQLANMPHGTVYLKIRR